MTSKLVVNTIEADTGISSVSFGSSISLSSTSKFFFGAAGIDIGADTNINRPASGVLGFNINSSEKARIDSSGHIQVNTTSKGLATYGEDLTIASPDHGGITIRTGTGHKGTVYFSDATSGAGEYRGSIQYDHADNSLRLAANSSVRLFINSSGLVNIGAGSSASGLSPLLHLHKNASNSSAYFHITNNDTGITNNDGFLLGINPSGDCLVFNKDSTPIRFATAGTERLRIHSDGRISVGTNTFIDGSTKFEVSGKSANTSAGGQNIHKYGSASAFHYGQYNSTGDASLNNQANAILTFATNNTERVRISSGGQLQISPAGAVKMSFYHDSGGSINHITSNNGNEIKVSSGNGDSNGIEFWDYTGTNKRCQIDGHGIKFNTDTAEANALDDYEEGTYVPSTNSGLTLNSSYNTLSYIKIGRCCTIRGLIYPNNNPSGSGAMTISLPFASYNYTGSGASIAGAGGSGTMSRSISGADAGVTVYISDNVSTATFYKNGSNGGAWSLVLNSDWNSGMEIYIDVTYFTV